MWRRDSSFRQQVEQHVHLSTAWRVRDLAVEISAGRVLLRGRASSDYVKKRAQEAVREALPDLPLDNAITVGDRPDPLPGPTA
jgi:hypothetical protein